MSDGEMMGLDSPIGDKAESPAGMGMNVNNRVSLDVGIVHCSISTGVELFWWSLRRLRMLSVGRNCCNC